MATLKEIYRGFIEAKEKNTEYLLPYKDGFIVIPVHVVASIPETVIEGMKEELNSDPYGLGFVDNDLEKDAEEEIREKFGFIFSDDWRDV